MNLDFQLIMVVATLVTGIIWLADAFLFAPKRKQLVGDKASKEPLLVEYSRSFFPIILIVLVLRSFIVEPFRIPSGSMMPTLLVGDFILVNKFSYGIRLPVVNKKVIETGQPKRGDVVVFQYPENPSIDYIKRVVGLPGDRVGYKNKQIFINGQPVALSNLGTYIGTGSGTSMSGAGMFQEQLGDANHKILVRPNSPSANGEIEVPAGHFFVMGDNRDNSRDSRIWGFLPEKYLKGKAFMIWMNWDSGADGVAWGRIGTTIR